MKLATTTALLLATTSALAQIPGRIYVTNYAGHVHVVQYTPNATSLENIFTYPLPGNPSWLFKGKDKHQLWYVSEDWVGNKGSLGRLDILQNGALSVGTPIVLRGNPVQAAFAFNDTGILTAQYSGMDGLGGGVQLLKFDGSNGTALKHVDTYKFANLTAPKEAPQDVPRAHGVTLDSTGKFAFVPDLGADRIRTMLFNGTSLSYQEGAFDTQLPAGYGPRHAVFFRHLPQNATQPFSIWEPGFLLVVNEIASTIVTYEIKYEAGNVHISPAAGEIDSTGSLPFQNKVAFKNDTRAAEIKIAPGNRFVTVSNRAWHGTDANGAVDTLVTFEVNLDGTLKLVDTKNLADSKCLIPRSFDFHPSGDKVLVACTQSSSVVVYSRDPNTGIIGAPLASLGLNTTVAGTVTGISHAIWD
jgi:6-phosphogluconolactonase (cycloisomerase 2 family)